ncbi:MAG TPA: MFS transporter [Polyangiaceae bacterium]|nr:MFS transporter [Polyangiaceae bacterium]
MTPSAGLSPSGTKPREPLTAYQRRLLAFLSVAAFFEGYDFIALTQILPNFRADMGVGKDVAGLILTIINFGTVAAYLLVRIADQWGRRRVLTVTIAGYTVMTFLSGLAPNPWVFAVCQMIARVFLIGEYATSAVVAAEEFPAARRGTALGVIAAFSSLGSVVCAGVVPLLLKLPWGWRSVYFVSILPLVTVAYARRGLRETTRFAEQVRGEARPSLLRIWRTPHRRRMLELGAIWFTAYIATQNGVTFWKDFAVTERGFSDADVGKAIAVAAVVAMPFVFFVGNLLDWVGRKHGAAIVFSACSLGTFALYTLHGKAVLTVALVLGIFASSAALPVLNSFTTELFPTEMRADGYAWSNNLIGRAGYVLSPLVIGVLAQSLGWGPVIRTTAIFPVVTIVLVYVLLPETKGRALEETSSLG